MAKGKVFKSKKRSPFKVVSSPLQNYGRVLEAVIPHAIDAVMGRRKEATKTRTQQAQTKKDRKSKKATGEYVGRFSRKKSKTFKTEGMYSRKGVYTSVEVKGTVSDPNVTYIGHSTLVYNEAFRCLLMALYRRLLEKAYKKNIESVTTLLTNLNAGTNGADIVIYYYTDASTVQSTLYTIGAGETLNSLANFLNPVSAILLQSGDTNKLVRLKALTLQDPANVGVGAVCEIDLRQIVVHYMAKSVLKLQNASTFTDALTEADEVNAVHLTGRLFRLKGVNPEVRKFVRDGLGQNFEWVDDQTGVLLQRGANLVSWDRGFNEVPLKQFFINCNMASKINLKPGGIKSDKITHMKSTSLQQFIDLFCYTGDNGLYRNRGAGKTNMLVLEKQISVGTNPINILYEKQQNIGCYVTEKPQISIVQDYYQLTYDKIA